MYKVVMIYPSGERHEEDELFETEVEANDHGQEMASAYTVGGEILNMSNAGDYPLKEDDDAEWEVIEVDA